MSLLDPDTGGRNGSSKSFVCLANNCWSLRVEEEREKARGGGRVRLNRGGGREGRDREGELMGRRGTQQRPEVVVKEFIRARTFISSIISLYMSKR